MKGKYSLMRTSTPARCKSIYYLLPRASDSQWKPGKASNMNTSTIKGSSG